MPRTADPPENSKPKRKTLPKEAEPYKFKPGVSGNPGGRPKKKWLTEVFEEMLEERLSDKAFREAYKESAWKTLTSGRVVGSMMLERVWERTEGKMKQDLDVNFNEVGAVLEEVRKRKAVQVADSSPECLLLPSQSTETEGNE